MGSSGAPTQKWPKMVKNDQNAKRCKKLFLFYKKNLNHWSSLLSWYVQTWVWQENSQWKRLGARKVLKTAKNSLKMTHSMLHEKLMKNDYFFSSKPKKYLKMYPQWSTRNHKPQKWFTLTTKSAWGFNWLKIDQN